MIDLDLRTRFGRLRAKLGAPDKPMRLSELAWNALSFDERLLAMAVKTDTAGGARSISCAKGCAACCRHLIPLSPPEAWMIADVVRAMPPPQRTAVLKRFEDVLTRLSESSLADRSLRETDDEETVGALAADFFDLQLACPFLEDEACVIHAQRPSICREFLVTTPAENCVQIRAKTARRVPVAMHVSQVLSRVAAKVLGRASETIPLHLALDWSLAHEEEGARTYDGKMLLETFFAEAQACQLGLEPAPPTGA